MAPPDRLIRATARLAIVLMVPLVWYFASAGTWRLTYQNTDGGWSGAFYWRAAEALLVHGRLDVDPADIIGECFERNGRCYAYFGLTPSLLRLPVLGLHRYFHSALTPIFLGAAILLAYGITLRLVQRALREFGDPDWPQPLVAGYFALVALALGPGSTLVFLSRPGVFEEALAWALAFVLLTINHVWKWLRGQARSLVPAVCFAVAAANARPTAALACGAIGLWLVARTWSVEGGWRPPRATRLALCLLLLPGATAGGVYWLKLRTPIPSVRMSKQVQEAPHWQEILQRNGDRVGGLIFTPTALVAYFRPDAVVLHAEPPYVDFRNPKDSVIWVPPLPPGGAYVETTASLTSTMPLPWLLNVIAFVWLVAKLRSPDLRDPSVLAGVALLAAAVGMAVLTVTTVGVTTRYLGDFYLFSVFGACLAPLAILPALATRPRLSAIAGVGALSLVIWAIVVTVALTDRLFFVYT